jgi:hypothetical protein
MRAVFPRTARLRSAGNTATSAFTLAAQAGSRPAFARCASYGGGQPLQIHLSNSPAGKRQRSGKLLGTRPPSVLSASKAIEEGEAPQSAGAEAAAPGGHLAVRPVPSSEGTAGP